MDARDAIAARPARDVFHLDGHNGAEAYRVTGLPFLADGSYAGDAWGLVRRDLPCAACGRRADPADADPWGCAHEPCLGGLRIAGVTSLCCGHGHAESAAIMWKGDADSSILGEDAREALRGLGGDPAAEAPPEATAGELVDRVRPVLAGWQARIQEPWAAGGSDDPFAPLDYREASGPPRRGQLGSPQPRAFSAGVLPVGWPWTGEAYDGRTAMALALRAARRTGLVPADHYAAAPYGAAGKPFVVVPFVPAGSCEYDLETGEPGRFAYRYSAVVEILAVPGIPDPATGRTRTGHWFRRVLELRDREAKERIRP